MGAQTVLGAIVLASLLALASSFQVPVQGQSCDFKLGAITRATNKCSSLRMSAQNDQMVDRRSALLAGLGFGTLLSGASSASAQDMAALRRMITGGGDAPPGGADEPKSNQLCEAYQCAEPSTETLGGALKPLVVGSLSLMAPAKGWTAEPPAEGVAQAWTDAKGARVTIADAPTDLAFRTPNPAAGAMFAQAVVSNDLARVGSALARARGAEYTGGKARIVGPAGAPGVVVYVVGLKAGTDRELLAVAQSPAAPQRAWTVTCTAPIEGFADYKLIFGEILQSVSIP